MIYFESFLRERQVHLRSLVENLPSRQKFGELSVDILVIASTIIDKLLVYCTADKSHLSVDSKPLNLLARIYNSGVSNEVLMNVIIQTAIKQYFSTTNSVTLDAKLKGTLVSYIQNLGQTLELEFSELDTRSLMHFMFDSDVEIDTSLSKTLDEIYPVLTTQHVSPLNDVQLAQKKYSALDSNDITFICSPIVCAIYMYRMLQEFDNLTLGEIDGLTLSQADIIKKQ